MGAYSFSLINSVQPGDLVVWYYATEINNRYFLCLEVVDEQGSFFALDTKAFFTAHFNRFWNYDGGFSGVIKVLKPV